MATPCHFVSETKLLESDHASIRLIIDIIKFRKNKNLSIQEIIEGLRISRLSSNNLKKYRKAVERCRTCSDQDLFSNLISAGQLLLEEPVPAQCQMDIQAVLADPEQMSSFEPVNPNEIQVMTLHRSKGLEFDLIFHIDLNDWTFPKKKYDPTTNTSAHDDFSQCLNLHYVGTVSYTHLTLPTILLV